MKSSIQFVPTLLVLLAFAVPVWAQAPLLTFETPNPEALGHFGKATASVPDVDGDGKADLVMGAPNEDVGNPIESQGRVYVFNGITGDLLYILEDPDTDVPGAVTFGRSVAGVSDLDGDGHGDLFVARHSRQAYVFSGATGSLLYTIPNPNGSVSFGSSTVGVPDIDGDGIGDLLIGADSEDAGNIKSGAAYLFSGATGDFLQSFISPNPDLRGEFGASVSGVPDTNGDGLVDLLIGAPDEFSDVGRAYLFDGATGALLLELASPNPDPGFFDFFGSSVVGTTDLDGDGRGDLLVGAWSEDNPSDSGRAYLFSGATGTLIRTFVSPNAETGGHFGSPAAVVPDVNGDGHDDLLIGAFGEDLPSGTRGRVYLFDGVTGDLLQTITSPATEVGFGGDPRPPRVSSVPDLDGDGRGDVLIGSFQERAGGVSTAGRAYVFSGAAVDLIAASSGPVTLDPGDTFAFGYAITSKIEDPLTGAIRAEVRSEDSTLVASFGPVVGGTLRAGATFASDAEQRVPLAASPGTYRYTLVAETTEGTLYDVETLQIVVTGGVRVAGREAAWPKPSFHGRFEDAVVVDASAMRTMQREEVPATQVRTAGGRLTAYPNPSSGKFLLSFVLDEAQAARVVVYDVLGREVTALADGLVEAGRHEVVFDGAGLPGGVYVVRLVTADRTEAQRITLVR